MWMSQKIKYFRGLEDVCEVGQVTGREEDGVTVRGKGEYRGLPAAAPWGIVAPPPDGARAAVVSSEEGGGHVYIGVVQDQNSQDVLEPGELRLRSLGGAEILLKNTGEVVINGQVFPASVKEVG